MRKPVDITLAFDKSARSIDQDGRMHVETTNISKANVCPYYGREIPGADSLGLNPDKIYMLYRDPKELALAADSFNNIPLLSKHVRVHADDPQSKYVVGSTGTDAHFDGTYLRNSIVIWDRLAIDGVESKEQCELSSAYRYTVDWTPGTVDNVAYDGRMTEIIGNHVALVEVGRAGPDVVVNDSNPFVTTTEYKTMKASRKAVAVRAALSVFLRPQLAMDAAIVDLGALVRGVTSATFAQDQQTIVAKIVKAIPDVDQKALAETIKLAADGEPDDEPTAKDAGEQQDGESDEDYAKRKAMASDAEEDPDKKPAMDAATVSTMIAAAVSKSETALRASAAAARQAERDVQHIVGEVVGMDSAEAIYKLALDARNVDVTGVHPSAYKALVAMQPNPNKAPAPIAQDAGVTNAFSAMFPNANQLKRG